MKEQKGRIFLGLIILVILVVLTTAGWLMMTPEPVIVQGEVEATQVKVSSKIAGRVSKLYVKEGERVVKGQILVLIDSPEIKAKMRQAKAAQQAAIAQKHKAMRGERKERVASAKNVWLKASAASELAQKTYARISKLYEEGVVPAQKKDEAEAKKKAAVQTEKAARSTYEMALTGAREEDKDAARALVDKAAGAVSEVESYLLETSLSAPLSAEVATISSEMGELIGPGYPIVNLVDLSDIWITLNLREDLLADIRIGDMVSVRFPALGNKEIEFKVNYITALGSYANWNATKTMGDFDMKTFEVRAVPVKKIEGLRPGMSAIIDWDEFKKNRKQ